MFWYFYSNYLFDKGFKSTCRVWNILYHFPLIIFTVSLWKMSDFFFVCSKFSSDFDSCYFIRKILLSFILLRSKTYFYCQNYLSIRPFEAARLLSPQFYSSYSFLSSFFSAGIIWEIHWYCHCPSKWSFWHFFRWWTIFRHTKKHPNW